MVNTFRMLIGRVIFCFLEIDRYFVLNIYVVENIMLLNKFAGNTRSLRHLLCLNIEKINGRKLTLRFHRE